MELYNFKYNSLLNTSLARVINGVVLFAVLSLWFSTTFHWNIKNVEGYVFFFIIAYVIFSTLGGLSVVLSKNKWCSVDKKENKNKEDFIIFYCGLSIFFSALIAIVFAMAMRSYNNGGQGIWLHGILLGYLIFNRLNICSLFNFNDFFNRLLPMYDCGDLDVIKHVLARDYYINLDELLWDSRRFKGLEK